jgi:hypothetical protein
MYGEVIMWGRRHSRDNRIVDDLLRYGIRKQRRTGCRNEFEVMRHRRVVD